MIVDKPAAAVSLAVKKYLAKATQYGKEVNDAFAHDDMVGAQAAQQQANKAMNAARRLKLQEQAKAKQAAVVNPSQVVEQIGEGTNTEAVEFVEELQPISQTPQPN